MFSHFQERETLKNLKARHSLSIALVLSVLCLSALLAPASLAGKLSDKGSRPAPAIRITPPAPVFDDAARLSELAQRRARVAERIGPKGMLVLFSTEPRVYANDVFYQYRQENNLYYLTDLKQQGATLVLMPGSAGPKEILFLPRRNPGAETWTGHMYSPEEARALSGITEIWEAREFAPFMQGMRARQLYRPKAEAILLGNAPPEGTPESSPSPAPGITPPRSSSDPLFGAMERGEADLYLLIPRESESAEYRQEQSFAASWAKSATGFNVHTAWPIFNEMRQRKSAMELQLMQHAIDISIEAHERAQAVAAEAQHEYEVDAEIAYTFKRRNADNWGYPDIVGCGPNATTLHYIESQGRVGANQLLLIDAGAEFDHYSADVTRTFPVSGKFTPEQAAVYQIVYDAQEAGARSIKPGVSTMSDVHDAATGVIKDGLLRLGLITDRESKWQYRVWFMHGTSHWLGMNVHDVGVRDAKLAPGMVFTNEPGIYIREDALDNLPKTPEMQKFIAAVRPAFEKYKGIGVRIEDDMLVTETGARWMTETLPRSIKEIEAFMARARQELRQPR